MMDKKLRVLLLVAEPWRCDDGGGNTLDNFFNGMDAEFAHVYCDSRLPVNPCCNLYFQMYDGEVVNKFFSHKAIGHELNLLDDRNKNSEETVTAHIVSFLKKIRLDSLLLVKDLLWYHSNWKTDSLKNFIINFNPDVIYAPCYASPFQLALTRWTKQLTGKKIVTWSADDTYSLKQYSLSPFYWIKRFWVRSCLRKTYPYYDAFYSISDDEAVEMENVVGQRIDILRKCVPSGLSFEKREVHHPIRMIYAGGIYIQRWKVLQKIGKSLKKINSDGLKCELHIYTQNALTKKQKKALDDGKNIYCHTSVSQDQLNQLYQDSDIALHVESQKLKYKLCTRLSFSTKIVDCLASGCAVMAIAWKEQTGLKYLQKNDAAICITNERDIERKLRFFIEHPEEIQEYAKRAYDLGNKNHNRVLIQNGLYNKLVELSNSINPN